MFEEPASYMYLCALINGKCEEECDINLKLLKSKRCAGAPNDILR